MSDEGATTSEATVSTVIDELPTETDTQVDTPIDLTEEAEPMPLVRQNAVQGQNQNGGRYRSKRRKLRKSVRTRKHKRRINRRHKRRKHTRSRRH